MANAELIQGRRIGVEELEFIRALITAHPGWSRRRLSIAVAEHFGWRSPGGQLRDMSTRLLLNRLAERGAISLPARQKRGGRQIPRALSQLEEPGLFAETRATEPIETALRELQPLQIAVVLPGSPETAVFIQLLARHHYLGFGGESGQNLRYLIRDRTGRDLGCALFAGAAWKVKKRDGFIGWTPEQRAARLGLITNNTRFLILPHVRVPHLASHVLGALLRRLQPDWVAKYGCKPVLAETFVERERFAGVCYRAANWLCVGQTAARGRNDRENRARLPVKDVLLYPLQASFKEVLCA